jgi:hypothetical protein
MDTSDIKNSFWQFHEQRTLLFKIFSGGDPRVEMGELPSQQSLEVVRRKHFNFNV